MPVLIRWNTGKTTHETLWSHSEAPEDVETAKRLVDEDNATLLPEEGRREVVVTSRDIRETTD